MNLKNDPDSNGPRADEPGQWKPPYADEGIEDKAGADDKTGVAAGPEPSIDWRKPALALAAVVALLAVYLGYDYADRVRAARKEAAPPVIQLLPTVTQQIAVKPDVSDNADVPYATGGSPYGPNVSKGLCSVRIENALRAPIVAKVTAVGLDNFSVTQNYWIEPNDWYIAEKLPYGEYVILYTSGRRWDDVNKTFVDNAVYGRTTPFVLKSYEVTETLNGKPYKATKHSEITMTVSGRPDGTPHVPISERQFHAATSGIQR